MAIKHSAFGFEHLLSMLELWQRGLARMAQHLCAWVPPLVVPCAFAFSKLRLLSVVS